MELTENIGKFLLFCLVAMPTNTAYCKNLHRRLKMQITELSADCVIVSVYLHATDPSQRIKQLQCIIISINLTIFIKLTISDQPYCFSVNNHPT